MKKDIEKLDRDAITMISRYILLKVASENNDRDAKRVFENLKLVERCLKGYAEKGQFNSALVCLLNGIKFNEKKFLSHHADPYDAPYADKFLSLFHAYSKLKRDKNYYSALSQDLQIYIHEFEIFQGKARKVKISPKVIDEFYKSYNEHSKDKNFQFDFSSIFSKEEIGFRDLKARRNAYLNSEYVTLKLLSAHEFLNRFKHEGKYAEILNFIGSTDKFFEFDIDTTVCLCDSILQAYLKDKNNPTSAFNYACMVLEHASKHKIHDEKLANNAFDILENLANREKHISKLPELQ